MIVYHVLGSKWTHGEPIHSLDRLFELGKLTSADYQWGEWQELSDYPDGDIISVHDTLEDAVEWVKECGGEYIAAIDWPEEKLLKNGEGYHCIGCGTIDPDQFAIINIKKEETENGKVQY